METLLNRPKVLMLGANSLVCANVRVLLRSMGYQCLVASALKEAMELFELEKADAAVLDPQAADSSPARVVAAFRPRPVTRGAPLVFDSFLEPSLAGFRSSQSMCRQLRYESDTLVADLSLEWQRDSQHVTLMGQLLDTAKGEPQLGGVPIVIQGRSGLIRATKANEWGEFHFEFEPEPGITLEIKARENLWVSAGLPDLQRVMS